MNQKYIQILVRLTRKLRSYLDSVIFCIVQGSNDYSRLQVFNEKDCLIVGNGPSLNMTELSRISMPSIAMNKINLLFDRTDWRPDCIVCVNGLVIRQNRHFFNETQILLILPVSALYLGVKKRSNILFIKTGDTLFFERNIEKTIGVGSTVTFICMQIVAYAKSKSINIVGVDHSFNAIGNKHEIQVLKGADINHFHPDYFKDMLWGLPDLAGSEESYSLAKEYFDEHNIPVIDYTIGGKLKVFKKGSISEIYS